MHAYASPLRAASEAAALERGAAGHPDIPRAVRDLVLTIVRNTRANSDALLILADGVRELAVDRSGQAPAAPLVRLAVRLADLAAQRVEPIS